MVNFSVYNKIYNSSVFKRCGLQEPTRQWSLISPGSFLWSVAMNSGTWGYGKRRVSWCGTPEMEDQPLTGASPALSVGNKEARPRDGWPPRAATEDVAARVLLPQTAHRQPADTHEWVGCGPCRCCGRGSLSLPGLTPSPSKTCGHKSAKLVGASATAKGSAGLGRPWVAPAWDRALGVLAGVTVPLSSLRHQDWPGQAASSLEDSTSTKQHKPHWHQISQENWNSTEGLKIKLPSET